MAIPPELPLLYHGKEIIMQSKSDANLIRHTVFEGKVQKSAIASYFKDLDISFEYCCYVPAQQAYMKVHN